MLSSVSPCTTVWKQLIVQAFGTVAATAHKAHMSVKPHGPHQIPHKFYVCTLKGIICKDNVGFTMLLANAVMSDRDADSTMYQSLVVIG